MIMRIGRNSLNMAVARLIAQRGTCQRGRVGCVITQDGRVVSTGYVGAPSGLPHCKDTGCEIGANGGCSTTSHAEAGAIAFAARKGTPLEGSTLYITMSPCETCAKLIINAGIKKVIYGDEYRDAKGLELLIVAGLSVSQEVDNYED